MTSNRPQTAVIATPQSKDDPLDVKIEEIPMPPADKWEELDNSQSSRPSGPMHPLETAVAVEEIAELTFVGEAHKKRIPIQHPFILNGETVDTVTVRRLRIGDVDRAIKRAQAGPFSLFDIYAEMTGLPAAVLRGLIDEDGDKVTDACYDFLPRALRADPASSEN